MRKRKKKQKMERERGRYIILYCMWSCCKFANNEIRSDNFWSFGFVIYKFVDWVL